MGLGLDLKDKQAEKEISRRQILMCAGAFGLLDAPRFYALARLWTAPTPLVFRIERDKREKGKQKWNLTKSVEDDFIHSPDFRVVPNDPCPTLPGQRRLRVVASFYFQGYEAEKPLRRRVELVATLLDKNDHPLISSSHQFLDRRRTAREFKNPLVLRRGGLSSRLGTSFNFRPEFDSRVESIEFSFLELSPLMRLPDNPDE